MEELRYEDSKIDERILRAVKELGFEVMTPIQAQAIPVMLEGRDIIGQAQTGTGKTAAFSIPVLQATDPEDEGLQALILCPTRELAIQAAEEMRKYAKYMSGIKVLPIYGGQDIQKQIRSLKGNVQIVVGTPGRIMDHMRRHTLKLENVKTIVLDEADEMLDMGFREDIETILEGMAQEHQTALFSATMPKPILEITKKFQKEDTEYLKMEAKELTIPLVKQYYYEVSRKNKEEVVSRLLDYYNPKRTLIFCNTKRMVDDLAENLVGRGYFAVGLHGDLSQAQRDRVMAGFRSGQTDILIATDVAARGIDVNDVEAVFNYDVPQDVEYYVHRIGRTGRAGKKGRAFTLVVGREIYKVREIEKICKTKIEVRMVPSAADIKTAKSEKILDRILDVEQNNDMNDMIRIIEQKLNDEDCTAIELAAAFLKEQMGADLEDIPVEDFAEEKKKHHGKRDGDRRRNYDDRDGDHRRHHSYRDGDHKRKYDDRDGDHKRKYDDRDGDHRRKHDDRDGGKKKKKRGNDERALNALNWQPPKKKKKKD
jgi:ATP-dependent RNA helicase DeaD